MSHHFRFLSALSLGLMLAACSSPSSVSAPPLPSAPVRVVASEPVPAVPPGPPVSAPVPAPSPAASNGLACAERLILVAAKRNVAENYRNSPTSGGLCALGVRTSLQRSRVGNVTGSLGNAIDFRRTLAPHGFVDVGARDPRRAPVGSVLVFSGIHSADYLRNGRYGRPAGDWLGHVTIKGDDGRYYTDGRTKEPALGWFNGVNEEHRRNVVAVLVPGATLAGRYEGSCAGLVAEEQAVDLSLAASEVADLGLDDGNARETGRRLVSEGLATLDRAEAGPAAFGEALRLARESLAFDDEGELTHALADRIRARPSLLGEVDRYLAGLPAARGIEGCKTKVLQAALARALCLESSEGGGQESGSAACGKPLTLASCVATSSW